MEARIGAKTNHFYGPVVSDLKAVGKTSMEWDLNNWKWDGDMLTATPLNSMPSDSRSRQLFPITSKVQPDTGVSNSSSSGSEEINLRVDKGKRELEKRRRVVVVNDDESCVRAGALNLKLGGQVYPVVEEDGEGLQGNVGKKSKVVGPSTNRAKCQVDDCSADLSNAKDYHRRHKVCDVHSKATKALVANVMQRFCQQCSRFHALQEFDEGKRSCRRRLAGHNRRRRKTHPENAVDGVSLNDEQGSSYLLVSLLRILSSIHSNRSDQINDQDLISHLLRNLSSLAGSVNEKNLSGLLAGPRDLQIVGTSLATLGEPLRPSRPNANPSVSEMMQSRASPDSALNGTQRTPSDSQCTLPFVAKDTIPAQSPALGTSVRRMRLNDIDLNSVYDDSQDCVEAVEVVDAPMNQETVTVDCPSWLHRGPQKSSPPQTIGNSGSSSTQSPSRSSGEAQSRTDRIVFKLFGKDPSELPLVLRKQILDWLSSSPTDIEGYIRPGCVLLTLYLRMENSSWEELCHDWGSSLTKLLDACNDSFWRTGWVYTRLLHHVAFVCDGKIVLNSPLPLKADRNSKILSIKPIAVPFSSRAEFLVKGFNLSQSTSRLLCALEGSYIVQGSCCDVMEGTNSSVKHEEVQLFSFSCSIPNVFGRGFVEIEDDSLSSCFFPFIVAEQGVCSEICTLESDIEVAETADDLQRRSETLEARDRALDFLNEIGWLLHRSHVKFRLASAGPNLDLFSFKRFRWLVEFSIDRDWCVVVNKLLSLLFSGVVDSGEYPSIELALLEISLLHRAVRRNCRLMVEALLNFHPETALDISERREKVNTGSALFRPDAVGPGGLTPLHVAASRDGFVNVVDALTDDPQLVGIKAWSNARDSAGLTPNDYALLRGHYSYIHLVQRKAHKRSGRGHVVVDIPPAANNSVNKQKLGDQGRALFAKFASFGTEKNVMTRRHCKECEQKLEYSSCRTSVAVYRPAMLSMVAIAAVCVCVALLFKSLPDVDDVFQPFCWECLQFGAS